MKLYFCEIQFQNKKKRSANDVHTIQFHSDPYNDDIHSAIFKYINNKWNIPFSSLNKLRLSIIIIIIVVVDVVV